MSRAKNLLEHSNGITRRDVLRQSVGAASLALLVGPSNVVRGASAAPVAKTTLGALQGRIVDGVAVFKGVRYGAPTGGANRFRAPQQPAPWRGVKDALDLGPPAPQFNPDYTVWLDPKAPSEDCLFLNVWSPGGLAGKEHFPVMVWLHGGGYAYGSGGIPMYGGRGLAKQGQVVVVTINHRLNIFGYSYLSLEGDDRERSGVAGNVGQLDIIAALKWVRDNIENFGGDPGNVTIFGQSGGGGKVSTLMGMPGAQKLFHKAIVQSGSFSEAMTQDEGRSCSDQVYRKLKIRPGDVAGLRTLTTAQLLNCWTALTKGAAAGGLRMFEPVVDGETLPVQPWNPHAPEQSRAIPMIIGTTSEETVQMMDKAILEPIPDETVLLEKITKNQLLLNRPLSAEKTRELIAIYRRAATGISNTEIVVRASTDSSFWQKAVEQATLKVQQGGAPVYMYEFAWKTPCFGGDWALHGVELPFVFGTPDYEVAWDGHDSAKLRAAADPHDDRYKLTDLTVAMWTNFARTGNPSNSTLNWPAYDLTSRPVMTFNRESHIVNDPHSEVRRALT